MQHLKFVYRIYAAPPATTDRWPGVSHASGKGWPLVERWWAGPGRMQGRD